jgi:hypothetical protein
MKELIGPNLAFTELDPETSHPKTYSMNMHPDPTQRPPRSPRVRLGGYVILARILDKGRAELAGTAGEYSM